MQLLFDNGLDYKWLPLMGECEKAFKDPSWLEGFNFFRLTDRDALAGVYERMIIVVYWIVDALKRTGENNQLMNVMVRVWNLLKHRIDEFKRDEANAKSQGYFLFRYVSPCSVFCLFFFFCISVL